MFEREIQAIGDKAEQVAIDKAITYSPHIIIGLVVLNLVALTIYFEIIKK